MKTKVAVLFGGKSTEHEVSRVSAASVLRNIDLSKYEVYRIGIDKSGKYFEYSGDISKIENGEWERDAFYKTPNGQNILFNKEVDVVFPVLHGLYGEDGTIQGLCELLDIPCVGPGVLSSAICMDKVYTKYLLDKFNIKQADYFVVTKNNYRQNREKIINEIEIKLGYNMFIKPSNSGSSVGITKAHNKEQLIKGIEKALKYDRKVLVEKAINAREIEVGVLGNDDIKVSIPGEIIPDREFYDYDSKYNSEDSKLLIPANLSEQKISEIRDIAGRVFKILDCQGMARVDFLIDKDSEEIYLNELNTIPGFTKISMYPKLWEYCGIKYSELITQLIELAINNKN